MDFDFGLSNDEVVLGVVEGVSFHAPSEGMSKLFNPSSKIGSFVLTNQRVLFCWEEGTFRKQQRTLSVPLSSIRDNDRKLQIVLGLPKSLGGPFSMTIYASEGQYAFDVPLLKKMSVEKLIASANELLFGTESKSPSRFSEAKRKTAKVGEAVSGAISSAKPAFQGAADVAKPFVPLAAEVVSAAFPGVRAVSDALANAVESKGKTPRIDAPKNDDEPTSMPVNCTSGASDDLSTLVKLKELLDSGILTQEEFDAKKKQLLRL